jgi:hypothetical protein
MNSKQARSFEGREVRIIRSEPELEALHEAWMTWPGQRDSDIDFYLMIVRSYPEVVRPHVVALYRDGQPESILVGRLEQKQLRFGIGYLPGIALSARCLTFVYGPIHGDSSAQSTELLLGSVIGSLRQGEADAALLEFVPVDTALYQLAVSMPGFFARDCFPALQGHASLTVPGDIEEVYRRMSRERRKHTRASVKKLESYPAGRPRIVCYRQASELDELFRHVEEIAQRTYQRGLGVGFEDSPRVRQRLELGAQKGWLRAYLLFLGERPCAFWIGMLYRGTFVSEYMGYDPEFRQYSPGMVLIMRVLEQFCSRSDADTIRELDFGLGRAEYKTALCSRSWQEGCVYIFSPTPRGLALKLLRTATRLAEESARRMLKTSSLFPRLKRAWRDQLARRAPASALDVRSDGTKGRQGAAC